MGFRLNLKWSGLSVQSPLSTSSSSWPSSYSCRARLSAASVLYSEIESLNDTSRVSPQLLENYYLGTKEIKVALEKGSNETYGLLEKDTRTSKSGDKFSDLASLQSSQASQFKLLMKNIDELEYMFADSNAVRLERDILEQLEKLGALRLFRSCLSRTLDSSTSFDLTNSPSQLVEETRVTDSDNDDHVEKIIVKSSKKELRKLRRKKTLEEETATSIRNYVATRTRRVLRSRNKRKKIAKNEAEMASGVKLVADLERIKTVLEEESGHAASLTRWAEAAGVAKKELQKQLYYGWNCRDELLRSTHSLILFIARNYWGLGVAFEDLIQAGNIGVLQGAERFDQSRGYKFSTYVQYWIRKSISTLVARHARGIRVPCTLSKAINKVQKARKTLCTSNGKYPDDTEIARFTGLSIAKIKSASKCLRVVGSIDQKLGDGINIKYMEITPDTSILSPEEIVYRQQMVNDINTLLDSLELREKQVLILRFGLGNHQCKSLEEIGRLFSVSKEWIRKIERTALTKLRNEDSLKILSHYVYTMQ